ncbi:hypothetical protein HDU98_004231 [Podochytrium sp. JEL0797]|nr:hypothetical protein HDU98_004231 [Podochytrium sp. JEL0797]
MCLTCSSWFSWLRSKAVVAIFFSARYVAFLQAELTAMPFFIVAAFLMQFFNIAHRIQRQTIVMGIGLALMISVDVSCLVAYCKQIFSLRDRNIDVPRAYMVIAKHSAAASSLNLFGIAFYVIGKVFLNANSEWAIATTLLQNLCLFLAAVVLLVMKIQLIQPSLLQLQPSMVAKNKLKGFLEGDSDDCKAEGREAGSSM